MSPEVAKMCEDILDPSFGAGRLSDSDKGLILRLINAGFIILTEDRKLMPHQGVIVDEGFQT